MGLGKKDIIKDISSKTHFSYMTSHALFNSFIEYIKSHPTKKIKISSFGSFSLKTTKPRIGRNPKTMETYPIPKKTRVSFQASKKVKDIIN
jgi:nucleoid DNA-binding protein